MTTSKRVSGRILWGLVRTSIVMTVWYGVESAVSATSLFSFRVQGGIWQRQKARSGS
jgi:hypothetical protein